MHYSEIHWSAQGGIPILALLQFLPLLLAAWMAYRQNKGGVMGVGVVGSFGLFLGSLWLYAHFDQQSGAMQFAERVQILGAFQYHAAVDGVSVLFTMLTAFLTWLIVLYGRVRPLEPNWLFLMLVFVVESAVISQFVTLDLLWFALISTLQMGVLGYVLWVWATSAGSGGAIGRYLQFMGVGAVLFFAGVVILGWNHYTASHGRWSFDLIDLAATPIQPGYQSVIFFLLFYGLAVRIPLFPFHGWLPAVAEHGMVAVAPTFLLGLKTGVFGLLRFVFPLLSEAVWQWHGYIVAFAVAGVFYAAILALRQDNLRRLLAFAVVSHTGILIIGLFSLGHAAFEGGVLLSVNFGLATAGLLFMSGIIHSRTGTMLLPQLGGLFDHFPLVGTAFLVAGLSIIGMPGTPGFDAVHLALEAAINRFGAVVTVTTALGNVMAAGFLLFAFQRAFLAQNRKGSQLELPPVLFLERFLAVVIIGVLIYTGFYTEPWLELIERSLEGVSSLYGHHA
ncbi:MAG: NADH-quinone oxidoreductase subunit M [Magnetococcales bacterium]|nr:NADH-quinone oxidoreductase subunit M [Magnetococcales bacterium]